MQNLFRAAHGKGGGGKRDQVGLQQQRKWLGGLCAHPVEQRVEEGHGRISYRVYGVATSLLQTSLTQRTSVKTMGRLKETSQGRVWGTRSSFSPFLILHSFIHLIHCFPFLVQGVSIPHMCTHTTLNSALPEVGLEGFQLTDGFWVLLLTVFSVFINFPHLGHMVCQLLERKGYTYFISLKAFKVFP